MFFFGWGERLKILYSRRVFLHSDFFTFFYFYTFSLFFTFFTFSDFFTFLHFYNFQIFSLFYIFTFLQFFRGHSSRCFFLCGEMLKNFFRGVRWTRLFFKKWGVAQTGPTALLLGTPRPKTISARDSSARTFRTIFQSGTARPTLVGPLGPFFFLFSVFFLGGGGGNLLFYSVYVHQNKIQETLFT